MRQVFSSPRLENVERVAALLRDEGIEVRVTDGRSYKGGLRGDFSYRDNARKGPVPAVWIVRSEDQVRGREVLRDAGLLDSTRRETRYALPTFRTEVATADDARARRRALLLKLGLLLSIAVALGLALFSLRRPAGPAVGTSPAGPVLPPGFAPTPVDLALAVLSGELPEGPGQAACLEVDGGDPSPALLAALPRAGTAVRPASRCAFDDGVDTLAVGDYRPGRGYGQITLERRRGTRLVLARTYDVRREDGRWRVIEPISP